MNQETEAPERDVMEYDVVTVGAGPAGLAPTVTTSYSMTSRSAASVSWFLLAS